MDADEKKEVRQEFRDCINMSPSEIEQWLDTDESKEVGQIKEGNSESQGRKSAKRIIEIKGKNVDEYSDADYDHMKKTISYVRRHSKQKPEKASIEDSSWRYSLKNWGHDPCKGD